jgi:hypothetical protein
MDPKTAKRKGVETENLWVSWLISHGIARAERRRLQGSADKGDIAGWCASDKSWNVVSEVKSGAKLNIPQWLRELDAEIKNADAITGHVVVRPKGKPNPDDWFIVMRPSHYMELMALAGLV